MVDYPYQAGRCCLPRYFGVAHGAAATGSQEPPCQLVEILVDYPPQKLLEKIQKDECTEANPSGAQDGPLPSPSPLTVQTYCDASSAPGGGRSRSGILVLLKSPPSVLEPFPLVSKPSS